MATQAFTITNSDLSGPTTSTTLITGGSSGIGLETGLLLTSLSHTNNVIILDRQPPPSYLLSSPQILFQQCDITSWASQRAAFAAGAKRFGGIDHVLVNAGIYEYKDQFFVEELDGDGLLKEPDRRTIEVDTNAANDTVKLAIYHLRKNGKQGGSIVLTASLAGYLGTTGAPLYSAAKHGIVGLMRALKNELSSLNIAISLVAPGITTTPLIPDRELGQTPKDAAEHLRKLGVSINEPTEVARAVVWLMYEGLKAHGKGLMIQSGRVADVEAGLAKNRKLWLGEEMLGLFKGERGPVLPGKL